MHGVSMAATVDSLAATFTTDGAIHSATTGQVFEDTEGIKEFAAGAVRFSGLPLGWPARH
jgi:hypothetical protein